MNGGPSAKCGYVDSKVGQGLQGSAVAERSRSNSPFYYVNITQKSDIRSKENIRALDSSLTKIKGLTPVKYDYKKDYFPDLSAFPELSKYIDPADRLNRTGLIAQEAKDVIPEIVSYDKVKDTYGIDYVALIPYLIGAIQDQQSQIEILRNTVTSQEQELIKVKAFVGYTEGGIKKSAFQKDDVPVLYQNSPNPFYDNTIVRIYLPENVQTAKLYVHSLNGTEIMVKDLSGYGDLNITINGSTLQKGMYLYTLEVDGKMVESKRMILTE